MPTQLIDVLNSARTYLNDDNATTFTDAVLIPKVKEAHRELQTNLWINGSPIVRAQSSVINVNASSNPTDLTQINPTNYPPDLLVPTRMFESSTGANIYQPLTETDYFAVGLTALGALTWWVWRGEHLYVGPCIANRDLVIQYRRSIPVPSIATDPIGIQFGEIYLAPRTAALAAGSVGNKEVFDVMTALSKESYNKLLIANRGQQKPINNPGGGIVA